MVSKTHTKTRTRVRTRKVWPPVKKNDPRVLGEGYYKFAWKMYPTNQVAVINSFDHQIRRQKPNGWKFIDWLASYTKKMKLEYMFTHYLGTLFGELIPRVFLFKEDPFYDRKFRYQKELCLPVEKNETLFDYMFVLEKYLLSKGWAYIDMKDSNLGILNGKYCLVDTDPFQFYRIPDDLNHHFRFACYMIIILVTDYLPDEVLRKKMKDLKLDMDTIEETYNFFKSFTEKDLNGLVDYGNDFLEKEDFTLTSVINPKNVIDWYGYDKALDIFRDLLKVEDMRSKPTERYSGNNVRGTGMSSKGNISSVRSTVRSAVRSTGNSVRRTKGTGSKGTGSKGTGSKGTDSKGTGSKGNMPTVRPPVKGTRF